MNRSEIIQKIANAYVEFADAHRKSLLLVFFILFGSALYPILTMLKIDNDLASLLPQDTPSVLALNESYERFGSTDKFMIAIQSSDPKLIAQLQDEIRADLLKDWNDILVNAIIDNDNQFFKKNALLYLPLPHLERIRTNLEEIQNELGRGNLPFVVDLIAASDAADSKTTEPSEKKERVWFDASIPQELGLPDEAADAFQEFFAAKTDSITHEAEWNPKANLPAELRTRLIGQLKPPETAFNGVIQCKLTRPSTDIAFVSVVTHRADSLLAKYRNKSYSSPVRFTIEGTYESLKEVEDLKNDSTISFIISGIMILILVVWFFSPSPPPLRFNRASIFAFIKWILGGLSAPLLLILQVGFACVLMLSFTALWYGHLNPFTLFVSSIIMGMGIDYSIHFMGTCQEHQSESPSLKDALKKSLAHLLSPMFLAAITTICGLLTLLFAHFTGFYEFGVIASVGIFLSVVSAVLALPVLILTIGGLPPSPNRNIIPKSLNNLQLGRLLHRVAIVALILSVPLAYFTTHTEFEHDFQKLRRPDREDAQKNKIKTGVAVGGKRVTSTPAVVMGDKPEQLDKLYDTLMVMMHDQKNPYLKSFLTIKTFVPATDDQEERLDMISEIRDLIEARVFDRASGQDSTNIATLRKLVEVESAFGADDLPSWSVDMLKEKNGTYGNIGFIYGRFRSGDAKSIGEFQDQFSHWNFDGTPLRVFSSQFIISDVVRVVKKDSSLMAILIIMVILATLAFSLRQWKLIAISSTSLLFGVLWTAGFMGLFTVLFDVCKIGIYNVIVIPTVLGVGIDSTIHLLISWVDRYRQKGGLVALYNSTGKMVIASTTTTMAGFGGVLFITHKGMRTIGEISVLGLFLFLLASLIFVPWLSSKLLPSTEKN